MNISSRLSLLRISKITDVSKRLEIPLLNYSTKHALDREAAPRAQIPERKSVAPQEYRFMYPEFLPDPALEFRNSIREKLERMDMLNRRSNIEIPEFYVGSIVAVTSSDKHAEGKTNRFLGICIMKDRCGLRHQFVLRNVIDHQGIEISFNLYDPKLQKIEVIRLEKRLDGHLLYLRDALPEYSTFDMNMNIETLPEGEKVPINHLKVILKPRPWYARWERFELAGIANADDLITDKMKGQRERLATPWEKYDLMKEYRRCVSEEEQKEIYAEVHSQLHQQELARRKMKRKRIFVRPQKLA